MRLHRFYVLQPLGEEVVIDDVSLVSQWMKVFRYQIGDFVILFNGDGNDYSYSLHEISKKSVTLIRTKSTPSYIPKRKITLYLSVIKKDNFELVVQKATELGITSIVPILSLRSEKKNLSLERLQKIATEASEQCGRGDIPLINNVTTLDTALSSLPPTTYSIMFNMNEKSLLPLPKSTDDTELALFTGPEGGWGDGDITLMESANLHKYSLGQTTLRAETAAISACALVNLL
mgnify:FL=1